MGIERVYQGAADIAEWARCPHLLGEHDRLALPKNESLNLGPSLGGVLLTRHHGRQTQNFGSSWLRRRTLVSRSDRGPIAGWSRAEGYH